MTNHRGSVGKAASECRDLLLTVTTAGGGRRDLADGEGLRFGSCPCSDCRPDLLVSVPLGQWVRGMIRARADHWSVDNLSFQDTLVMRDLEDGHQMVSIPPGRLGVTSPFELASLGSAGQLEEERLTVFAHESVVVRPELCPTARGQTRRVRFDPGAMHTLVLAELVAGFAETATPPTSEQIAFRLRQQGVSASRRAVDRHIDYLFQRLYPDAPPSDALEARATPPGWKRRAVALMGRRALSAPS